LISNLIPSSILLLFSALLGGTVGSFLNVCIYRIPIEGLRVSHPRGSFCPSCKSAVRWFDNVPVFAWLWLRGRCRDCSEPISSRYPLVEGFTACIFLLIAWRYGGEWLAQDLFSVLLLWIWVSTLIVVSGIDLDHRIIPDRFTIPGTSILLLISPWMPWLSHGAGGLGQTADPWWASIEAHVWWAAAAAMIVLGQAFQRLVPTWQQQRRTFQESLLAYVVGAVAGFLAAVYLGGADPWASSPVDRIFNSLSGAAVGAGTIWGIGWIGSIIFRKPAMGFGDVKWMGFLGATLGPEAVLVSFLIACLLGSVVGIWWRVVRGSSYIPFGPFLAAGAASMLLARPELQTIWELYIGLFQGR